MDEGTKNAELIFRVGIALKAAMLKMAIAILKAYIAHMEWLKQHNIKPSWKARIDKIKVRTTKTLCTMIEKQKDNCKEIVKLNEKELDKFKLDKQHELEQYNTEVNKAKKALELAQEGKNPDNIIQKQQLLDQALENKRQFEYETNKELLDKNNILEESKNDLKEVEYDLKVCNAELNALYSDRNVETGRLKHEYSEVINKYQDNDNELNVEKDNLSMESNDKSSKEKIVNDVNQFQDACEDAKKDTDKDTPHDYESNEYYDNLENNIDKLSQIYENTEKDLDSLDNEKADSVELMLSKNPDLLKIYQGKKENGDFKINIEKDKDLGFERG